MLGLCRWDEPLGWKQLEPFSMDTVKPIKAAYYGLRLEDCPRGLGKWNVDMYVKDKRLLKRNLGVLKGVVDGL